MEISSRLRESVASILLEMPTQQATIQTAQQNPQQQELTFQLRICHDSILRKKYRHTLVVQSGICATKLYLDECIILRLPVPVIEEACADVMPGRNTASR